MPVLTGEMTPNGLSTAEVIAAAQEVIASLGRTLHWQITCPIRMRPSVKKGGGLKLPFAILTPMAGPRSCWFRRCAVGFRRRSLVRSVEEIRKTLPLAADLGIHILIENVWNRFLYEHDGPNNQSAEKFAAYLDAIDSPGGAYSTLGTIRNMDPAAWIRTLGSRLVMRRERLGRPGGWLVLVTAMLIGRSTKPCRISVSPVGSAKLAWGHGVFVHRG